MKRVSREGTSEKPLRPYEFITQRSAGSEFPLGDTIARRLDHEQLDRQLRFNGESILAALGRSRALWFERENLVSEQQIEREEAHFDVGYEYGFRAGRADSITEAMPRDLVVDGLADRIRDAILESGADLRQTMSVLAQTIGAFIARTPVEMASPTEPTL